MIYEFEYLVYLQFKKFYHRAMPYKKEDVEIYKTMIISALNQKV